MNIGHMIQYHGHLYLARRCAEIISKYWIIRNYHTYDEAKSIQISSPMILKPWLVQCSIPRHSSVPPSD